MASTFLKVQPVLDTTQAQKLENDLNRRFTRVAKNFSTGLEKASDALHKGLEFGLKALAGGGLLAVLINPLDNVLTRIDNVLKTADDIGTVAKDLNVDPAALQNLQNTFKVYGVSNDEFLQLLNKFSTQLGLAKTGQNDTLSQFSQMGTLEAFNKALQAIKEIKDPAQRAAMEQAVLGRSATGGLREIINTSDIERQNKLNQVAVQDPAAFNKAIDKTGQLEELQRTLEVQNQRDALMRDMQTINEHTIIALSDLQKSRDQNLSTNIANADNMIAIAKTVDTLAQEVLKLTGPLFKLLVPALPKIIEIIDKTVTILTQCMDGIIKFFGNSFVGKMAAKIIR
jgi:hypothetical protein